MEAGDEEALSLWRRFKDYSVEELKEVYKRLNVDFDVWDGESLQKEGYAPNMLLVLISF
jgi:arginyl-tRNA synthetase